MFCYLVVHVDLGVLVVHPGHQSLCHPFDQASLVDHLVLVLQAPRPVLGDPMFLVFLTRPSSIKTKLCVRQAKFNYLIRLYILYF